MGNYRVWSQSELEEFGMKQEGPWISFDQDKTGLAIRGLAGYTGEDEEAVLSADEPLQSSMFGCEQIKRLVIPADIKEQAALALKDDSGDSLHSFEALEEIKVEEGCRYFSSREGVLYSKDGKTLVRCPRGWKGGFILPVQVERIHPAAFYGCAGIEDIRANGNRCYTARGRMLFDKSGEELIYAFPFREKIVIPAQATRINNNAFVTGESILDGKREEHVVAEIEVEKGNPAYLSEDGVLYNQNRQLLRCPRAKKGECLILDGAEDILSGAFAGCVDVSNVLIPKSIRRIENGAFSGRFSADIFVDSANESYMAEDGVLFSKDGTTLVYFPANRTGEYHIPARVTEIVRGAFYGNRLDTFYVPKALIREWVELDRRVENPDPENGYKRTYLGIRDSDLQRVQVIPE